MRTVDQVLQGDALADQQGCVEVVALLSCVCDGGGSRAELRGVLLWLRMQGGLRLQPEVEAQWRGAPVLGAGGGPFTGWLVQGGLCMLSNRLRQAARRRLLWTGFKCATEWRPAQCNLSHKLPSSWLAS